MSKLTKNEIKHIISYDLEKAFKNKNISQYWLDRLPTNFYDYDTMVHEFIEDLKSDIRNNNIELYNIDSIRLVEHYYINQEFYENFR